MGIMTVMKGTKALKLQKKGEKEEAVRLYEEAFAEGLNDPRYLLPYALLILRDGQYQKAKDFLVAHQKAPGMTPSQRTELLVYYAVCCMRLGTIDKGINALEQQGRKMETGLIYQTLGYLYVDKYDLAHRPDFAAMAAEEPEEEPEPADEPADESAEEDAGTAERGDGEEPAEKKLSPEEEWNAGVAKAEEFIRKSIDYDDEDPICLDNMAQYLYRVQGDRAAAKEWFEKAIAQKENQIDTLCFLSRYDEEAGDRKAALEKLEKALEGRFSPLNYFDKEAVTKEISRLKGE